MPDRATPNLPSRDFDVTERFYGALGFERTYRDGGWMILRRATLLLEFFHCPDLDPTTSAFGCCLRLDDLEAFVGICRAAAVPDVREGWPRLHPPQMEASGLTIAYLIDPDCSLLRLIQND